MCLTGYYYAEANYLAGEKVSNFGIAESRDGWLSMIKNRHISYRRFI
jgi:hypothetical protein